MDLVNGKVANFMVFCNIIWTYRKRNHRWFAHSMAYITKMPVVIYAQSSKIRKKVQFQNYKSTFFYNFKNDKKTIFAPEKSPKIAFLVLLKKFLVQKLFFCHFWNCKRCVFPLLKLHFFSNFRALCSGSLCISTNFYLEFSVAYFIRCGAFN